MHESQTDATTSKTIEFSIIHVWDIESLDIFTSLKLHFTIINQTQPSTQPFTLLEE